VNSVTMAVALSAPEAFISTDRVGREERK
jgi:hypothetical protein